MGRSRVNRYFGTTMNLTRTHMSALRNLGAAWQSFLIPGGSKFFRNAGRDGT